MGGDRGGVECAAPGTPARLGQTPPAQAKLHPISPRARRGRTDAPVLRVKAISAILAGLAAGRCWKLAEDPVMRRATKRHSRAVP